MTEPTQAYTVDLQYPPAFVFGQVPLFMQWVAATAGKPGPSPVAPFTFCDLGCGDGITLHLLAAAYPWARFIGFDINRDHLHRATELAAKAGLRNIAFREASFTELAADGLEPMDYIAVHGVYSWVDDAARNALHDIMRTGLKPGGLLGLQYSSLPGSAVHDPLFNYVKWLADGVPGDSLRKFSAGLERLQRLRPHATFFQDLPQARALLDSSLKLSVNKLAHDVLNRNPHSLYGHEVHERMASLGLDFVGSADLKFNRPELLLPRAACTALEEVAKGDERLRLMALDLMLNTRSRFDVFRRHAGDAGTGKAAPGLRAIGNLHLRRMGVADNLEARRQASSGIAVDLCTAVHTAVLAAVGDGSPTVDEVLNHCTSDDCAQASIERAIEELLMMGFLNVMIGPARDTAPRADRRYRLSSPLNSIMLDETIQTADAVPFASPVLGTALMIPADARLCLAAWLGRDLAQVWNVLERANRRVVDRRGGPIHSADQFRAEVEAGVPKFVASLVPGLFRYGLLDDDGPAQR